MHVIGYELTGITQPYGQEYLMIGRRGLDENHAGPTWREKLKRNWGFWTTEWLAERNLKQKNVDLLLQ